MAFSKRPIAVDLFAGAGGLSLGFEQAGFDVLAAVEVDPVHCATYQFNFPVGTVICKSVVEITGAEIRQSSVIGDRDIDVVMGGAPCQGFSIIGKRGDYDSRNELIFEFGRLVLELQPKFFVMENVPGILRLKHRPMLERLIEQLQSQGYRVDYQILNAAHYRIPQTRKRLFLLGCRRDFELPSYPPPITQAASPDSVLVNPLPLGPTVWEALADLPEVEHYPELLHRDWVQAEYGEPSQYTKPLRGIERTDWAYPRYHNEQLLSSSRRTQHTEPCIQRFRSTKPGEKDGISRFYRLHPNGVCNTLRAGTDRHRGSFTAPRPIHPDQARCITVREAARLHSYPDWFRFHVTKWHGFRQVGNSVPPRLAQAIASEIIRILDFTPVYPSTHPHRQDEQLLQLNPWQAQLYFK